jgi:hypothetical protein
MQPEYSVFWGAGGSAQVELFCDEKGRFRRRCGSAFHPTLRSPPQNCPAGPGALRSADVPLSQATARLRGNAQRSGAGAPSSNLGLLKEAGSALFQFLRRGTLETELRTPGFFVEIGTDDNLVSYPWELMYDGEQFLCLKHYVGRYVVAPQMFEPQQKFEPIIQTGDSPLPFREVKVLLISVPNPDGESFLPGAAAETLAVTDALTGCPGVCLDVLESQRATIQSVRAKLRERYHIIHFCGHAVFDASEPGESGIILHKQKAMDQNILQAFDIVGLLNPSVVLSFINACQTAVQPNANPAVYKDWETSFNTFGLARAFMEAGSYLLGSRWKLSDVAAKAFAVAFYKSLLEERRPIGRAIQAARLACKEASPEEDIAWASYVYYGDPRVGFRQEFVSEPKSKPFLVHKIS